MGQKTMRDEIRTRLPKAAAAAVKSRSTAVRLFCVECMGGQAKDARNCAERDCFLWLHAYKKYRLAIEPRASLETPLPGTSQTQG